MNDSSAEKYERIFLRNQQKENGMIDVPYLDKFKTKPVQIKPLTESPEDDLVRQLAVSNNVVKKQAKTLEDNVVEIRRLTKQLDRVKSIVDGYRNGVLYSTEFVDKITDIILAKEE